MNSDYDPITSPQPLMTAVPRRRFTIGLPACASDNRFAMSPECAGRLVDCGFDVIIESGAAKPVHYSDAAYSSRGATVADRVSALRCDIVVAVSVPPVRDITDMRRGAMLLTMSSPAVTPAEVYRALLRHAVVTIDLGMVTDARHNRPFADILSEVDGRAAIVVAASIMASTGGKGILPGGVAGVAPCEVVIIGADAGGCAAARSAAGLGAMVRMFDDDTYRLREAVNNIEGVVAGTTLHGTLPSSALASADIVIATAGCRDIVIDAGMSRGMKACVIAIDLDRERPEGVFAALPQVRLGDISACDIPAGTRVCLRNTGNAVPRTACMALGDTLLTMLREVVSCDGVTNALRLSAGLQAATLTFLGKATNREVARATGVRHTDINLLLQFS